MRSLAKAECGECGAVVLAKNLGAHAARHSSPSLVCGCCGRGFRSERELAAHAQLHSSLRVLCPDCGRAFRSQAVLRSHRARKHPARPPPAQPRDLSRPCPRCGTRLHRDSLQRHLAQACPARDALGDADEGHPDAPGGAASTSGGQGVECAECGKAFSCPAYLRRHSETHAVSDDFACAQCSAAFRTRRAMEHHRHREHPDWRQRAAASKTAAPTNTLDFPPPSLAEPLPTLQDWPSLPSPLLSYSPTPDL